MFDKNGNALAVGDYVVPDKGLELHIISEEYVAELNEFCMFGQQVQDPRVFSLLTQDDLKKQWKKKEKEGGV